MRSLADVLGSGGLARLADAAGAHRDLTERVRAALPEAEAAHLVGVHAEPSGRLVVAMDSPAWAARVRYMAAGIAAGPVRVTVVPRGAGGAPIR